MCGRFCICKRVSSAATISRPWRSACRSRPCWPSRKTTFPPRGWRTATWRSTCRWAPSRSSERNTWLSTTPSGTSVRACVRARTRTVPPVFSNVSNLSLNLFLQVWQNPGGPGQFSRFTWQVQISCSTQAGRFPHESTLSFFLRSSHLLLSHLWRCTEEVSSVHRHRAGGQNR